MKHDRDVKSRPGRVILPGSYGTSFTLARPQIQFQVLTTTKALQSAKGSCQPVLFRYLLFFPPKQPPKNKQTDSSVKEGPSVHCKGPTPRANFKKGGKHISQYAICVICAPDQTPLGQECEQHLEPPYPGGSPLCGLWPSIRSRPDSPQGERGITVPVPAGRNQVTS